MESSESSILSFSVKSPRSVENKQKNQQAQIQQKLQVQLPQNEKNKLSFQSYKQINNTSVATHNVEENSKVSVPREKNIGQVVGIMNNESTHAESSKDSIEQQEFSNQGDHALTYNPNSIQHTQNAIQDKILNQYESAKYMRDHLMAKKQQLRDMKEEIMRRRENIDKTMTIVEKRRQSEDILSYGTKSRPKPRMGFNLEPYLKHAQEIELLLKNPSFDNTVNQFSSDLGRIAEQMKSTLGQIIDVKGSFKNSASTSIDAIEMKERIKHLQNSIAAVQEEKKVAANIHNTLSATLREKDREIAGALKRENVQMNKMQTKIREMELISFKQQETMQMILKISQYKQISPENLLELYQRVCQAFDSFQLNSKVSDLSLVDKLNKLHQDFLLDSIRLGPESSSSDVELIKIILRNKKNSVEAREWIERRIEESKLENRVREVLGRAVENGKLLQKTQMIQKQPDFLENTLQNPILTPRRGSFVGGGYIPKISSPAKSEFLEVHSYSTHNPVSLPSDSPIQSGNDQNSPRPSLVKSPTQPSKSLHKIIHERESQAELKKSKSIPDINNEVIVEDDCKSIVLNVVMDPKKQKNITSEALRDQQEEFIMDFERYAKLNWTEEEIQKDLEQERELYERTKTLSMYFREKERAARHEKELEAAQIAILKDLEQLEKKRLRLRKGRLLSDEIHAIDDGQRCFVFLGIYHGDYLWSIDPFVMSSAVDIFQQGISFYSNLFQGSVIQDDKVCTSLVFKDLLQAISFALELQIYLHNSEWPAQLQRHKYSKTIKDEEGNIIFSGLRIMSAVHIGSPSVLPSTSGKLKYKGAVMQRGRQLLRKTQFGEVAISSAVYQHVRKWDLDADFPTKVAIKCKSVEMLGDGILKIPEPIRVIVPQPLKARYKYHSTHSNLLYVKIGQVYDLYPMIETLINTIQSTYDDSERDDALNVLRHVHMQIANVLATCTKEREYTDLIHKQIQFRDFLKRVRVESKNITSLKEKMNEMKDEVHKFSDSIMKQMENIQNAEKEKASENQATIRKLIQERNEMIKTIQAYDSQSINNNDNTHRTSQNDLTKLIDYVNSLSIDTPVTEVKVDSKEIQTEIEEYHPIILPPEIQPPPARSEVQQNVVHVENGDLKPSTPVKANIDLELLERTKSEDVNLSTHENSDSTASTVANKESEEITILQSNQKEAILNMNALEIKKVIQSDSKPNRKRKSLQKKFPQTIKKNGRKDSTTISVKDVKTLSNMTSVGKQSTSTDQASINNVDKPASILVSQSCQCDFQPSLISYPSKNVVHVSTQISDITHPTQNKEVLIQNTSSESQNDTCIDIDKLFIPASLEQTTINSDFNHPNVESQSDFTNQDPSSISDEIPHERAPSHSLLPLIPISLNEIQSSQLLHKPPTDDDTSPDSNIDPTDNIYSKSDSMASILRIEEELETSNSEDLQRHSDDAQDHIESSSTIVFERPVTGSQDLSDIPTPTPPVHPDFAPSKQVPNYQIETENDSTLPVCPNTIDNSLSNQFTHQSIHQSSHQSSDHLLLHSSSSKPTISLPPIREFNKSYETPSSVLYSSQSKRNSTIFPTNKIVKIGYVKDVIVQKRMANDTYFAKTRSEYVDLLKDLGNDMKQKMEGLQAREQTIRRQEKEIRYIFKQLLNLYKKQNTDFIVKNQVITSPDHFAFASQDANSLNARVVQNTTTNNTASSPHSLQPVSNIHQSSPGISPIKPRFLPHVTKSKPTNWSMLQNSIASLSQELKEMPNYDPQVHHYINGNGWMESLRQYDPKHIFDHAPPFTLKNFQLFGPSSINPQEPNKFS